ncbi:HDIG domain-containing protein [bacterium]|nr:HDIG domain-containing protein [bacterium]MBQ6436523.1 HDIG domain-containing protein [bacterium]
MLPQLTLPAPALYIVYLLKKAGFEAYLIGGSVRDVLANAFGYYSQPKKIETDDFDYATSAVPEETMKVFPNSFYKNTFGTVSVTPNDLNAMMGWQPPTEQKEAESVPADRIDISGATRLHESLQLPSRPQREIEAQNYEITTFRMGEKYEINNRQPSSLEWGKSIRDDLSRRDFTINALAMTFPLKKLEAIFAPGKKVEETYTLTADEYELIDAYHGLDDLRENLVKAIGNPSRRFQEDALRLLRAVRLSVQLNFAIEEQTYQAIGDNSDLLATISQERIRDELLKILASDYPKEGIMLLDETGLLKFIIPELLEAKDVAQSGHHLTDVWVHSLDSLGCCPSKDPIVRLATLLHDIGKPQTQKMIDGQYTFYNHQVVGAHMAKKIAMRLKLPREQVSRIFLLVRHHMFHYQSENTDASIRRFMRQVGLENLNDILDLREADRLGSNARKTSWRLEEMKQRMIEQLHQPMQVRDLAIDGHDLMKEFNLQPGPILGKILSTLLEEVLENAELNEREALLKRAEEILQAEKAKDS